MEHYLKFWLCVILMFFLFPVSEPRLIISPTRSYQLPVVLDAKELYQIVSAFNGTNKSQRRPERASPGGPDPAHH